MRGTERILVVAAIYGFNSGGGTVGDDAGQMSVALDNPSGVSRNKDLLSDDACDVGQRRELSACCGAEEGWRIEVNCVRRCLTVEVGREGWSRGSAG